MASIFSKIVNGELPAHKVAEDERFLAFLDIFPLKMGHVLVIPKQEIDFMYDLPDTDLGDLHIFAKKVAQAMKKVIPCTRIVSAVVGLEIPHAHLHLVPIDRMSDLDFTNEKLKPSQEELEEMAARIKGAM